MIAHTTIKDAELMIWAAWRGRVLLVDNRTAVLIHWPLQGARCQIELRNGARIRVRKADVVRHYGFITIDGQTFG